MVFEAEFEEGEEVLYGEVFAPHDKVEPFALGVSNRAVYFAEKKTFAVRDPWQLRRFRHSEVRSVELMKHRPYLWWLLSAVFIIAGLVTSIWVITGWSDTDVTRSGYPFGVLAVGLVLPFVVRGRTRLRINTIDRSLDWRSPLTVNSSPRKKAREMQLSFMEACKAVGIATSLYNA
jgi:hypothetical protein